MILVENPGILLPFREFSPLGAVIGKIQAHDGLFYGVSLTRLALSWLPFRCDSPVVEGSPREGPCNCEGMSGICPGLFCELP